jgi:hypothetical protein
MSIRRGAAGSSWSTSFRPIVNALTKVQTLVPVTSVPRSVVVEVRNCLLGTRVLPSAMRSMSAALVEAMLRIALPSHFVPTASPDGEARKS